LFDALGGGAGMIVELFTRRPSRVLIDLMAAKHVVRKLEAGKTMMPRLYSVMFETRTGENKLNQALRAHPNVEDWCVQDQAHVDHWVGRKHLNSWVTWA
jgi:hypothetical protein